MKMEKIKLITLEQLMEMDVNGQKFKLVEVLGEDSFKKGHIPGAINIPVPKDITVKELTEVSKVKGVKKTDTIVTYCASYPCHASTRAATLFLKAGFKKTLDFKASKKGWVDAGFELE